MENTSTDKLKESIDNQEAKKALMKVTWIDVTEITGASEQGERVEDWSKQLWTCVSFGYIIENTDDLLVLVKEEGNDKPDQILLLPKSLVKKIEKVGEMEEIDFSCIDICLYQDNGNVCPLVKKSILELGLLEAQCPEQQLTFPIACSYVHTSRCTFIKPDCYTWRLPRVIEEHMLNEETRLRLREELRMPVWMELPDKEKTLLFTIKDYQEGDNSYKVLTLQMNNHSVELSLLDSDTKGNVGKINNELGMGGNKVEGIWNRKIENRDNLSIDDKGEWEPGVAKDDFWEVFLHGNKYTGRWVARRIRVQMSDKSNHLMAGKSELIWNVWKPNDQEPYAVGNRARTKGWYPPRNYIPIPNEWIKKHPKEFKKWYGWVKPKWRSNEEEELEDSSGKFSVQRHWWGKAQHWDISIRLGKGSFTKWAVASNPTQAKMGIPILVLKKATVTDSRWFNFSGAIPPGDKAPEWLRGGNPTKNFTAYVRVIDSGSVEKVTVEGKTVYHFKGKKMKGYYAFRTMGGPMEGKLYFLKLKEPQEGKS